MRIVTLTAVFAVLALLLVGCEGDDFVSTDGDYDVGTVRFVYSANQTWTLRDVIVTIDSGQRRAYFSGIDAQGLLWGWAGSYTQNENQIVALNMPEIDFGSDDQVDLRIEFTSNSRFEGVAINWVYDGGSLEDVGAANVTGRETFINTRQVRTVEPTGDAQKARVMDAAE